jgi:hypothetical protein
VFELGDFISQFFLDVGERVRHVRILSCQIRCCSFP